MLSFSYGRRDTRIARVKQEMYHERPNTLPPLTERAPGAIDEINSFIGSGMSPFQICEHLRRQFKVEIQYSEIYYYWNKQMEMITRRGKDPIASSLSMIEQSDNLDLFYKQKNPFCVGFLVRTGIMVSERRNIVELLIDSTYKTNSGKMELFAVIGSVLGAGFPLAYILLDPSTPGQNEDGYRIRTLTAFLHSFKRAFPSIRPLFFFSDKDKAQLSSIYDVYKLQPSICLWHMKRAVKKKLNELRKSDGHWFYSHKVEQDVMLMITRHYHMHPFFVNLNLEGVRNYCTREMRAIYAYHPVLQIYLMDNWYAPSWFAKWGRRRADFISISKTTMMVESHWRVLKRLYLQNYNRPRVDLLVYIIDKNFLSKFNFDFEAYITGRKKASWWKVFCKEWKAAAVRPHNHDYGTDKEMWKCSCAAFMLSRFMFCKHLVHDTDPPLYRDIARSRRPPFLRFQRKRDVHVPTFTEEHAIEIATTQVVEKNQEAIHAASPYEIDVSKQGLNSLLQLDDSVEIVENNQPSTSEQISSLLEWTINHHRDLCLTRASAKQVDHLHSVLQKLFKYRLDVENNLRARTAPKTWTNRNALNLP